MSPSIEFWLTHLVEYGQYIHRYVMPLTQDLSLIQFGIVCETRADALAPCAVLTMTFSTFDDAWEFAEAYRNQIGPGLMYSKSHRLDLNVIPSVYQKIYPAAADVVIHHVPARDANQEPRQGE